MDDSDIVKYRALYLQTAKAYLRDLQHNLKILLQDQENADAISVVHLASHSLASQSLVMGYKTIGSTSFDIEKIFKAKMEGHLSFSETTLQMIYAITEKIDLALEEIEKSGKEFDLSEETKKLDAVLRL